MHKDSTTQAKQKKDGREEILKEIRQLENRQKILENKQRNEERKARTRRLIERGAILEGIFPLAPDLPGIEVKAFLIALSHLPGRRNWPQNCRNPGTSRKSLVYKGRTYTPLPVSCALPGAVAYFVRDGELHSPNPLCAAGDGTSASGCPVPCGLNTPHRKEVPPIDFCHIPVSIIKRSEGRSAVCRSRLPKRNQADE